MAAAFATSCTYLMSRRRMWQPWTTWTAWIGRSTSSTLARGVGTRFLMWCGSLVELQEERARRVSWDGGLETRPELSRALNGSARSWAGGPRSAWTGSLRVLGTRG